MDYRLVNEKSVATLAHLKRSEFVEILRTAITNRLYQFKRYRFLSKKTYQTLTRWQEC